MKKTFLQKMCDMASIDYVQALGAGAGFDTKKIVEALVNAERAPPKHGFNQRLQNPIRKLAA